MLLLVIQALGIRISWGKGSRGKSIEWIGVAFLLQANCRAVTVTLTQRFVKDICEELLSISKLHMLGLKRLRSLTGKLSWAAGVLPRTRWAVRILYGTVAAAEADRVSGAERRRAALRADSRPKECLVATKRCALPLAWLSSLWSTLGKHVSRTFSSAAVASLHLVIDASPWGLGGFLLHRDAQRAVAFFACPLTPDDVRCLGIVIGDSSCQGVAESLTLLVAIRSWGEMIRAGILELDVRSDSTTALALGAKLASGSPVLNFIGAELALELERLDAAELDLTHLPGAWNTVADHLSRRFAPGADQNTVFPDALKHAKQRTVPLRTETWYRLPPPAIRPELWNASNAAGEDLWTSLASGSELCYRHAITSHDD
jgi:hypothetical protein